MSKNESTLVSASYASTGSDLVDSLEIILAGFACKLVGDVRETTPDRTSTDRQLKLRLMLGLSGAFRVFWK